MSGMDGLTYTAVVNLEQTGNFLGGSFLIFVLIFLGILIFMTISNCVIYGIIISEDQNKNLKIDKGYAIFMLALNVIGLLVIVFLFFWILFKFKSYRKKIKETIQYVMKSVQNAKKCEGLLGKAIEENRNWNDALSNKEFIARLNAQLNPPSE